MTNEAKLASINPNDIAELIAANKSLSDENVELKRQLAWFQKQLFGQKSERRLVDAPAEQLSLGVTDETTPAQAPAENDTVKGYARRKRALDGAVEESGLRFDVDVPVQVIEVPNPETDGLGPEQYEVVSEKATYRLAQRPGSYVVLKYVRRVIKRKDSGALSCPKAPEAVLARSYADVSFLAGLLIDKFVYHLPLYRQHQRLAASGIMVSRGWLTNLVHRAGALLEPIYDAQLRSILQSRILSMDETPIKAGRKHKGKMRNAYFWPLYGERDEVAFPYFSTRAARHVRESLEGFEGTLLTDGYSAYARYAKATDTLTHAQCWVHTRRQFIEAEKSEPSRVAMALEYIRSLYRHEEIIVEKAMSDEHKQAYRLEHSKPVVEAFFAWLDECLLDHGLTPTDPFTKAANYALLRRAELSVFLADPQVPLDTNHLERALRPIPMGRKSWLFCWTEVGAKYVGIVQSLLVTCRLHGVDPYTYLVDVLQRVDSHPMSRVAELTPRLWKETFADNPLRSAIDPRQ